MQMVPFFEALVPLWMHHPHHGDGVDCTHPCWSPNVFRVAWSGLIREIRGQHAVRRHTHANQTSVS